MTKIYNTTAGPVWVPAIGQEIAAGQTVDVTTGIAADLTAGDLFDAIADKKRSQKTTAAGEAPA